MKQILFLAFFSFTYFNLHAEKYAVALCENQSEKQFKVWCAQNKVSFENVIAVQNYYIIDMENLSLLNDFCFNSKVKFYQNHLAFNTNKILVKTKYSISQNIQAAWRLTPHAFIPNLYFLNNAGLNDAALKIEVTKLQNEKWSDIVEVNQIFTLSATTNDPIYDRQWAIANVGNAVQYNGTVDADMEVDSAWTLSTGDTNIKIAIMDSGVDTLHEDLVANLLPGFDAFSTDTTDTKGFPTPNFDSDGHGTACAGIVAAVANNNKGVAGVAYTSKIVPVRIFFYKDYGTGIGVQPTTSTTALINGTAYAWRVANVDVISVSAGLMPIAIAFMSVNTQIVEAEISEAFTDGRNGYGIPMFFSSGNEDEADVLWPAELNTTIAVGASTMCDERKNPNDCSTEAWGSSYGTSLDIIAPGVKIATTDMTGANGYGVGAYINDFNGTSAACPNAAAVGALILSVNPILHAYDVRAVLNKSADKVSGYSYDSTTVDGTWNEEVGHGRVNAFEAVKLAVTYFSTGVESLSANFNVHIFPNPANGSFVIQNNNNAAQEFLVYNLLGVLVQQINVPAQNELKVNLPNNNAYIIKSANGNYTEKVVVY